MSKHVFLDFWRLYIGGGGVGGGVGGVSDGGWGQVSHMPCDAIQRVIKSDRK